MATIFAALVACGCQSRERIDRLRSESLGAWNDRQIDGVSAPEYLRQRTALVLGGVDGVMTSGGTMSVTLNGAPATHASGGAAVCVDTAGYWLTAAHCLQDTSNVVARVRPDKTVEWSPIRVVWRPAPRPGTSSSGTDLALIFTPRPLDARAIELADKMPCAGEVLSMGSGIGAQALCAGRITGCGGDTEGTQFWCSHDAPNVLGDSGGPVMLVDGRLAGINVASSANPTESRRQTDAAWMPPSVLRELIEQDRAHQPMTAK